MPRQMLCFIICLFYMGKILSQPSSEIVPEIQSLLENTEKIKLSNHPQFLENLNILKNKSNIFSNNQRCFYHYLNSYKIMYEGKFEKAKEKATELLRECKGKHVFIKLNGFLASISAISGDYNQAISRLDNILPLISEVEEKDLRFYIYQTAFNVYRLVNQAELSIKFSDLMIKEDPPKRFLCKAKVNKNLSYFKLKNRIINDGEINDTVSLCLSNKQNLYAQLLLIYWLSEKMQDSYSPVVYQHLLDKLKLNEAIIEDTKFTNIIGIKNSLLAQLHEKLNQTELAKKYAELSIDGSISIGETAQKIKALDVLVNYYQKKGDYQKDNEYLVDKKSSEKKYNTNEQANRRRARSRSTSRPRGRLLRPTQHGVLHLRS